MKAVYNGVELHGTPKEIAETIAQMKDDRYGNEAQRRMFDRQEGEIWRRP